MWGDKTRPVGTPAFLARVISKAQFNNLGQESTTLAATHPGTFLKTGLPAGQHVVNFQARLCYANTVNGVVPVLTYADMSSRMMTVEEVKVNLQ